MRDDDLCRPGRQRLEGALEQLLGHRVDVGRGFVEDEHVGIAQHGAHERDELLLPETHTITSRGNRCVEPLLETREQLAQLSRVEPGLQLLRAQRHEIGAAVHDVVAYGSSEEKRLLQDEADASRPLSGRIRSDVAAVELHATRHGIVEPRHQRCGRGLAAARRPDERIGAPALQRERHRVEHRRAARIGERHLVERQHVRRGIGRRWLSRHLRQVRFERQHLRHTFDAGHRHLERRPDHRELTQRHVEVVDVDQETDQQPDRGCAAGDQREAVRDHDHLRHVERQPVDRDEHTRCESRTHGRRVVAHVHHGELVAKVIDAVERENDAEVADALLHFPAEIAQRLKTGPVASPHPAASRARQQQDTKRRHERRRTKLDVEREQRHGRPRHHDEVAGQLHQRLREELIQLVRVVVDARNQIAGAILMEEVDRQLLKLREQRIA